MTSWRNATADVDRPVASTRGILRAAQTALHTGLRRDYPIAPALRPFVERYWSVRWDRSGRPPFTAQVLPDPSVNVSVESGTCARFDATLPAVLVHGVVTRRFVLDLVGVGSTVAVKFRPGGFTAWTGLLAAPDVVLPLSGVLGVSPGRLLDAVLAESADQDRVAVLDALLAPHAPEPAPDYLGLLELVAGMRADRSLVRVDQVAARGGVSVRALQRLFARFLGVGPKGVLARYRLQDAAAAIDAGAAEDLAALAVSLGWYDQAHFSRDFRAAIGLTPTAYAAQTREPGRCSPTSSSGTSPPN